ncbi:MAG: DUF6502 family protein [Xanthomonadales bacterium]|jgi:hypothetical protein|nr:DUF6502 family protein [Xanthomonadales bacterium]
MSAANQNSPQEVAVLTKSIEFVVRNFLKILIGKISLVRLQQLVQSIFVEEAENYLQKERPGKEVSLTALAVLTGADTRKLTQVRNSDTYRRPLHQARQFLEEVTPESCVIELWTSNPRFTDLETGTPRTIDLWGEEGSFEILVREAVRTRGVTVQSMAERMQRNNLVDLHPDGTVELKLKKFAPLELRQKIGDIKLGLDAVGHLLGTVNSNLNAEEAEYRFFQRGSWTHRLSPENRKQLETRVADHLAQVDNEIRTILESFEEEAVDETQIAAGAGFFYFETDTF